MELHHQPQRLTGRHQPCGVRGGARGSHLSPQAAGHSLQVHLISYVHSEVVPHLLCLLFLAWPKKAAIKRYYVLTDKKKNFFVDSGPGGVNGGVHFTI